LRRLIITGVTGAVAITLSLAVVVPGVVVLARAPRWRAGPGVRLRALAQRSVITDAAGNLLGYLGSSDREFVALDEIPKLLQDAVVAVEDSTFWSNAGIDVNGVLRAALANLRSGVTGQGGSTITQQLVKNRVLTSRVTIERKLREMVLAVEIADRYSKRQILEQYLNTVYFGQGAYGVKAAMERLFLRDSIYGPVSPPLAEITPGQAALLAGLIASPEGDNPFVDPARAGARRSFVLDRMVSQGVITDADAAAARAEALPGIRPPPDLRPRSSWVEELQDRLLNDPLYSALGATTAEREKRLLTGGLRVTATLDPVMQQAAQDAMAAILPEKPGFTGALVAIDPRSGEVKAMVAGPGFEESQYNIATSLPGRQAGSTWKVMTLAAALEQGFSPDDRVSGTSPCDFGELGATQNAEPGDATMTLRSATAHSVNCAFVRTELAVGFPEVIDAAHRMGIDQQTLQPVLTLTLGAIESTPLEMATVAATIANGGIHHRPTFVHQITASDGTVVFDAEISAGERAIPADVAACETDILRDVITSGTGTAARLGTRPVAGKTGTTDAKTDANFLGFTPQLATFVWHGDASGRVPGAGYGGEIPARIFQFFMTRALQGTEPEPFPDPGPVCDRPGKTIANAGRIDEPLVEPEAIEEPPAPIPTSPRAPTTSPRRTQTKKSTSPTPTPSVTPAPTEAPPSPVTAP
jgi:penicillin-binding protein 1A